MCEENVTGYVLRKACNTQLFIIYAFESKSVKSWITGRIDEKVIYR